MSNTISLSPNALTVLNKRYLLKDQNGVVVETPAQMFRRVADYVDGGEGYAREYEDIMSRLEFLPNSPTLMNAGTGKGTLSACFVLPIEDTMQGIMKAATDAAMVQKFGGGTGFALSGLREKGARISTTHGQACGPIAVLRVLSAVSTMVTQGGKRDGANMAVMNVHHPDIMEFIKCKTVEGEIHNFNISVGVTDEFMEAVGHDRDYEFHDPRTGKPTGKKMKASVVWDAIINGAWLNGEPGVIFLDEVNRKHPGNHVGEIVATNPCGEQPLLPNESCNLGSINLNKFVTDSGIDKVSLEKVIRLAIRFLDNVIDRNEYATPEIEKATKYTRKVGLGVMGWADALVRMGIPYGSPEAISLASDVMGFIQATALHESEILGKEKGSAPALRGTTDFITPRRNVCVTSIAPTGTIGMIADASAGIEPLFSLAYRKHNILGSDESLYYVNEDLKRALASHIPQEDIDFIAAELANGASLLDFTGVPDAVKKVFVTSDRLAASWHVKMQAAFQEYCDSGVSKTINMPNKATVTDVANAYVQAWQSKCKGITVYRAGSREQEVLTAGHNKKEDVVEVKHYQVEEIKDEDVIVRERPVKLHGTTYKRQTGKGVVYVTVNDSNGAPFEVFATVAKSGSHEMAGTEAITRMISLALRSNVPVEAIVRQLRGISDVPVWDNGKMILSVPDAIASVLDEHVKAVEKTDEFVTTVFPQTREWLDVTMPDNVTIGLTTPEGTNYSVAGELCPECSSILMHREGCASCVCGYSRC